MDSVISAVIRFITLAGLLGLLAACQPGQRERPYGTIKIGKLEDYSESEMSLPGLGLLLRRDVQGYSAMSTYSTVDLYPLVKKKAGAGFIFSSEYDSSTFSSEGKVLTGPAKADLPYYRLYIDQEVVDSPRDTLFVRIGDKVSKDWRLNPDQPQK